MTGNVDRYDVRPHGVADRALRGWRPRFVSQRLVCNQCADWHLAQTRQRGAMEIAPNQRQVDPAPQRCRVASEIGVYFVADAIGYVLIFDRVELLAHPGKSLLCFTR